MVCIILYLIKCSRPSCSEAYPQHDAATIMLHNMNSIGAFFLSLQLYGKMVEEPRQQLHIVSHRCYRETMLKKNQEGKIFQGLSRHCSVCVSTQTFAQHWSQNTVPLITGFIIWEQKCYKILVGFLFPVAPKPNQHQNPSVQLSLSSNIQLHHNTLPAWGDEREVVLCCQRN